MKLGFEITLRFEFKDFALIPTGFIYITSSEMHVCKVSPVTNEILALLNQKKLNVQIIRDDRIPIVITNTGAVNTNGIILDSTSVENSYSYEIN